MNKTESHLSDEKLFAYLDEQLAAAEREAFERHLEACAACAAQTAGMRALFSEMESLPEIRLRTDLSARVLARLPRPVRTPRALKAASALQLTAAVVILALSVPLLVQQPAFLDWSASLQAALDGAAPLLESLTGALSGAVSGLIAAGEELLLETSRSLRQPDDLITSIGALIPLLISSSALWVVGNGILIRRSAET